MDDSGFHEQRSRRLTRVQYNTGYKEPHRFTREDDFKKLILESLTQGVSDIYIQPGTPIACLIEGNMYALTNSPLDIGDVELVLSWVAGRETAVSDIAMKKPVNTRYEVFDPTVADDEGEKLRHGYRVNAVGILHDGSKGIQIVLRAIANSVPTKAGVGLSDDLIRMCTPRDGIVYVAGRTSSGKTTTIGAIVREIMEGDTPIKGNIVTLEEPVEINYRSLRSAHSIIVQSQLPDQLYSFADGIKEAMRRAPAAALIGELRDEETIMAAVEMSLTGHPVYGTVHASNVSQVMRRLISRFPKEQQGTAIYDIVDTARVIMAQRLVPRLDGKRVAAREFLCFTEEMRDQLGTMDDMGRVTNAVKQLVNQHGHSFAKEGERLFNAGLISEKVLHDLQHA